MASMDYCYWRGERCRYSPDSTHCDFHTAMLARDTKAMIDALSQHSSLPAGVSISLRRAFSDAYYFDLVAQPDE